MFRAFILIPALGLVAGCATMTQGTSQDISVLTPGVEGATCVVANERGAVIAQVSASGRVRIAKSRRPLAVRCEKPGFRSGQAELKPSMSSRARVQAPLGYAVDGLSGAMWSYPPEVSVGLAPEGA